MVTEDEFKVIRNNVKRQTANWDRKSMKGKQLEITLVADADSDDLREESLSLWKFWKLDVKLPKLNPVQAKNFYGLEKELETLIDWFDESEYAKVLITRRKGIAYEDGNEFVKGFLSSFMNSLKNADTKLVVEDSE